MLEGCYIGCCTNLSDEQGNARTEVLMVLLFGIMGESECDIGN